MVVGACQSFQFFRQIACFHGNNRTLSKFEYWTFHLLIRVILNCAPTHSHLLPSTPTLSYPLQSTPTLSHPIPPTFIHSHPLPTTLDYSQYYYPYNCVLYCVLLLAYVLKLMNFTYCALFCLKCINNLYF